MTPAELGKTGDVAITAGAQTEIAMYSRKNQIDETYKYRGHSIRLGFQWLKPGHLQCTYFIDANYCFQSEADAVDAGGFEALRGKSIQHAHESIDLLC